RLISRLAFPAKPRPPPPFLAITSRSRVGTRMPLRCFKEAGCSRMRMRVPGSRKPSFTKWASVRLRQSARRVRYEVSDSAVSAVAVIFYDGKVLFGDNLPRFTTDRDWLASRDD